MAHTTSPLPTASGAFAWTGPLAQGARSILDLMTTIAAAGRVANAVEARRQPALADLRTLGISRALPRTW